MKFTLLRLALIASVVASLWTPRAMGQATSGNYGLPKPLPTSGLVPNTFQKVSGPIGPQGYNDIFPSTWDVLLGGSLRTVLNNTERDSINTDRRKELMEVAVVSPSMKKYRLEGGIDNTNWVEVAVQNIYTADGTLTANRVITGNAKSFSIVGPSAFTLSGAGAIQLLGTTFTAAGSAGMALVTPAVSAHTVAIGDVATLTSTNGIFEWSTPVAGAGGASIYTTNGTFTSDRIANLNTRDLSLTNGDVIDISGFYTRLRGSTELRLATPNVVANNSTALVGQHLTLNSTTGIVEYESEIYRGSAVFTGATNWVVATPRPLYPSSSSYPNHTLLLLNPQSSGAVGATVTLQLGSGPPKRVMWNDGDDQGGVVDFVEQLFAFSTNRDRWISVSYPGGTDSSGAHPAGGGGGSIVWVANSTTADLPNVDPTLYEFAITLGRDVQGDGGGGMFYFVTGSTSSLTNGTTIIRDSFNTGNWFFEPSQFVQGVNPLVFGAHPGDATDDTAAIQAAYQFATAPTYGPTLTSTNHYPVVIPAGYYLVSTLYLTNGGALYGAGSGMPENGSGTVLRHLTGATGDMLIQDQKALTIDGFDLQGQALVNTKTKIAISAVASRKVFTVATGSLPATPPSPGGWPYYGYAFFYDGGGEFLGSGVVTNINSGTGVVTIMDGTDWFATPLGSGNLLTTLCKVIFSPVVTDNIAGTLYTNISPASAGYAAIAIRNTTAGSGRQVSISHCNIESWHVGIRAQMKVFADIQDVTFNYNLFACISPNIAGTGGDMLMKNVFMQGYRTDNSASYDNQFLRFTQFGIWCPFIASDYIGLVSDGCLRGMEFGDGNGTAARITSFSTDGAIMGAVHFQDMRGGVIHIGKLIARCILFAPPIGAVMSTNAAFTVEGTHAGEINIDELSVEDNAGVAVTRYPTAVSILNPLAVVRIGIVGSVTGATLYRDITEANMPSISNFGSLTSSLQVGRGAFTDTGFNVGFVNNGSGITLWNNKQVTFGGDGGVVDAQLATKFTFRGSSLSAGGDYTNFYGVSKTANVDKIFHLSVPTFRYTTDAYPITAFSVISGKSIITDNTVNIGGDSDWGDASATKIKLWTVATPTNVAVANGQTMTLDRGKVVIGGATALGTLTVEGSQSPKVDTYTTDVTLNSTNNIVLINASANMTVTLPAASNRQQIQIMRTDLTPYRVTVVAASGETIYGRVAGLTLYGRGDRAIIQGGGAASTVNYAISRAIAFEDGGNRINSIGGWFFEDFTGAGITVFDSNWTVTSTGTGAGANIVNGDLNSPGSATLSTGTTTTGGTVFQRKNTAFVNNSTNVTMYHNRLLIANASDGTETFTVDAGFMQGTTSAMVDGVTLRYTHSLNSGNWTIHTVANSVATDTTPTTNVAPVPGTYQNLDVAFTTTLALAWVDGVFIGSATTGIPTATTAHGVSPSVSIWKSAGTTARVIQEDNATAFQYVTR